MASTYKHRHSFIAHALWRRVVDAEYRLVHNAGWLASAGGMRGNPRLDQTSVDGVMRNAELDAEAAVPYWTGGMTGADAADAARAAALADYEQLRPVLDALAGAKQATDKPRVKVSQAARKITL